MSTATTPGTAGPRRWQGRSLRWRLTVLTAGLLCLALAVGAVALTSVLQAGRVGVLDEIVRARVSTVADLAATDTLPRTLPVAEPGEIVQLLDADGAVIASSPNASMTLPVLSGDTLAALVSRAGDGTAVGGTDRTAYDQDSRVAVRVTDYRGAAATVVATVPLREVQGLVRALRVALIAVVPILTALLAAAIWLVLGRALLPVEQLRSAAAQVARSGGPGSLPVPSVHDELGALATTLNEMLDRLEVAAARQRTFVADAAHELRSPLAAVRAAIDVAAAHPDAYTSAELAAELTTEVARMQQLVDDLLLLARVGSTRAVRTDVDLLDVVRAAVDLARATRGAGAAPVEVVGGPGRAEADPVAVGRVVRNLVDNAVRHAAARVQVTVGDATVVVDDDGSGIAEADRERVFERFVRLDDAREREAGGSGLGLAIAREIARDHGGDVELGDSVMGGLRATLRLPPPG